MLLMDTVHIASRKSWLTLALDQTSVLVQTSLAHSSFLELSNECHPCVMTLVSALPHPSYLSVETGDALNCQKCLHPPFFLCSAPMPWPMLPLIHLVDMWLTFFFPYSLVVSPCLIVFLVAPSSPKLKCLSC